MQREILKFQEKNTSYTEEILESSFADKVLLETNSTEKHMGHEENWRRILEEEITIIKSSNANLMMMMNNITLVAGMAPFLHAGCTVGRNDSSTPLAKLGQKPSSEEQITRARFGLPLCYLAMPQCPGLDAGFGCPGWGAGHTWRSWSSSCTAPPDPTAAAHTALGCFPLP